MTAEKPRLPIWHAAWAMILNLDQETLWWVTRQTVKALDITRRRNMTFLGPHQCARANDISALQGQPAATVCLACGTLKLMSRTAYL